mmetsp:Transcript_23202/g.34747  ORF Transcript_23202/g.34747 Transcript_23202/m.34747 type:complete len:399 (+) Transcript_23202:42-1238(+)
MSEGKQEDIERFNGLYNFGTESIGSPQQKKTRSISKKASIASKSQQSHKSPSSKKSSSSKFSFPAVTGHKVRSYDKKSGTLIETPYRESRERCVTNYSYRRDSPSDATRVKYGADLCNEVAPTNNSPSLSPLTLPALSKPFNFDQKPLKLEEKCPPLKTGEARASIKDDETKTSQIQNFSREVSSSSVGQVQARKRQPRKALHNQTRMSGQRRTRSHHDLRHLQHRSNGDYSFESSLRLKGSKLSSPELPPFSPSNASRLIREQIPVILPPSRFMASTSSLPSMSNYIASFSSTSVSPSSPSLHPKYLLKDNMDDSLTISRNTFEGTLSTNDKEILDSHNKKKPVRKKKASKKKGDDKSSKSKKKGRLKEIRLIPALGLGKLEDALKASTLKKNISNT